jgi:AcrR family transcriptional regulator
MGRAHFGTPDFLAAARALAAERGPAAVTVGTVVKRLKAPVGSFYHRFVSRDALLGELWLAGVLAFQEGLFAAIETGDGLTAALHMSTWVRANLDDACLLLLHNQRDFVQGDWPAALKQGVADQARRLDDYKVRFARNTFGDVGPDQLKRAQFVLIGAPGAAVHPHLLRREPPPLLVDELIRVTYYAVVAAARAAG